MKGLFNSEYQFVLASQSIIRKKLLQATGLTFNTCPADIDEEALRRQYDKLPINDVALLLSDAKGLKISNQFPSAYVISADQLGLFNDQLLTKTADLKQSIEQLFLLQGKQFDLITATSLFHGGECLWHTVQKTRLKMKLLTKDNIRYYVQKDKPIGTIGGFYYEQNGHELFEEVIGHQQTILGFECQCLIDFLVFKNLISAAH